MDNGFLICIWASKSVVSCCHIQDGTGTLATPCCWSRIFRAILTLQWVGPTHEKGQWLCGFYGVACWAWQQSTAITQQLSCPLNTHKTGYAVVAHDYCRVLGEGAHSKECTVKICLLSVWCHSFLNVKLFLSFYLAFFFSNSQMSRTGISYF